MDNQGVPKPWPDDPLSCFLASAQFNERATSLKFPDLYALLQRVDAALAQVSTITEHENTAALLPTRFLMPRARAAWLAAVRLAMSGEAVEAQPLIRVVIENAWYALHAAKDPASPARVEVWLRSDESDEARDRCANEFGIGNVRKTHRALDAETEALCGTLYKMAISYGGHPNQRGVLSAMRRREEVGGVTFLAEILSNNPILMLATIKEAVEAAIGVLKVFRLIFPERFSLSGLDAEIDKLVAQLNAFVAQHRTT